MKPTTTLSSIPSKPPPLLDFQNLTILKGRNKKVLDTVSLTIQQGENVAILGPNGAGKSSLIKAVTREYYPLAGVKNFTFNIWGQKNWDVFELRHLLGVVSNDLQYTCNRDITGMEMVLSGFFGSIGLFHPHLTAKMKKKATEALKFLEVYHLKDRAMKEMSSGEARRLLIGRALVHDPKALILDEPANSLDLHALIKFRRILRKISRSGTNIILVTQNLQDIIPEMTRVILLKDGKIFKDGPKKEVLTQANINKLFEVRVELKKKNGFYYVWGY